MEEAREAKNLMKTKMKMDTLMDRGLDANLNDKANLLKICY